ncbi:hypothetical protein CPLU01_04363 [Colletotrichum plurivorum]|uniref:Uncharacterized protein n=1 Tax=Colletotrichum plurivorum TaxID=2175906 RepID=A0A8H6KQK3_9PEZI|nr:hypothetical protein CPLU01_04363 [Colletotrichum plurivorum]
MSLPGPSVSTITSLRPEFDTLYRLKEQLEANQDTWKAAYSSLGMRLAANVDEYKVFSHGLQARQSQLISEAYDKPLAEQLLGRSERCMFPPLDRLIFSRADSVITCNPNEPEPTESRHDESDPQDVIRYADQATQFPDITPPQTMSALRDAPTAATAEITSRESINFIAVIKGCPVTSVTESIWSAPLGLTRAGTIKTEKIALYAFSCPKDCGNSAFTTHPLKGGRAAEHLGKCGVEFQNEEDMVQRYAVQVIQERKDRCLRVRWAIWHNNDLRGRTEAHLHLDKLD